MSKRIQLFCIPYAGGTAEAFEELARELGSKGSDTGPESGVGERREEIALGAKLQGSNAGSDESGAGERREEIALGAKLQGSDTGPESGANVQIETVVLEYAGHGKRHRENFYEDFAKLTQDLVRQIHEKRDKSCPYALLGYSMGSIAAYEVLASGCLEDTPCHIFLAAHEAPDVEWECKRYPELDDDAFLDTLLGFGGFSEKFDRKLLKNRFFRRLYFDPIREDYRLLASYRMQKRIMLPAKTTIFYAPKDITAEQIHSWDRFTVEATDQKTCRGQADAVQYVSLGCNHFFIRDHAQEMAQVMRRDLFL